MGGALQVGWWCKRWGAVLWRQKQGNVLRLLGALGLAERGSPVPLAFARTTAPCFCLLQVCDIVGLDWETTQSLNQGDNEYRPALVLHVLHSGSAAGAAAGPAAAGAVAGEAAPQAGDRDTAAKQPLAVQQLVAPQRTPDSAASRPGSRARSRLGAEAAAGSTSGSQEPSPSKAALAAGMVTPQPARPSPGAAASGRLGAGVGGSIRRYAVMLNMRRGGESDGEEDEEGSEDGRGGQADGSSSDDELDQRQQAAAAAAPTPSTAGHDRRAALQAAAASPLPPQLAQQGGPALGSSLLQREWQLLGELEYVLRLCILESREQLPHHEVPVRPGASLWGLPRPNT